MAQNRKPPAYLEYAATILANRQYPLGFGADYA